MVMFGQNHFHFSSYHATIHGHNEFGAKISVLASKSLKALKMKYMKSTAKEEYDTLAALYKWSYLFAQKSKYNDHLMTAESYDSLMLSIQWQFPSNTSNAMQR